mgnify:CR=1 FL=1
MKTLREVLKEAQEGKYAVPHFNVTDLAGFRAIAAACKETGIPMVIGTSEGERSYIGVERAVAIVRSYRAEGIPLFLNADHTSSVEKIEEAARAGYDAVLFDGGKLPWEENLLMTKAAVEITRAVNPEIVIEAELGYIGSGSSLRDELPEGAALTPEQMTKPEEAKKFVEETGIDMLAPAVGTIHGMLKKGYNPNLHIGVITEVHAAVPSTPLVLHGGSGTPEADLVAAVEAGIGMVHVSTELRKAWRKGLDETLAADPDLIKPKAAMAKSEEYMKEVAIMRAKMFTRQ